MNHLGAEGYHWRVCVEDKPIPGGNGEKTYSWWDIQDENARLPVKESPQSELVKLFAPPKPRSEYDAATKAAKGAFKSLGKAMTAVAGEGVSDIGPPVPVIAFKLLDLMKMHDDFATKHGGRQGVAPPAAPQPRQQPARTPAPVPRRQQEPRTHAPSRQQAQQQAQQPRTQQPPRQAQQDASLLDFGAGAPAPAQAGGPRRELHHTSSSPAAFEQMRSQQPRPPANETRVERLQREYTQKQSTPNRVWDEVDQRWVTVDPKVSNSAHGTSAPSRPDRPQQKTIGIRLDASSAAGKSASVQAAVNKRVGDMQQSQQKALSEMRQREEAKKKSDSEEDDVRKRLEPRIKAWSEEHGQKKQLRALLGTMQNILWAEANWTAVGLGDLLDDSKCRKAFHKASRVVHPDKTHHLDAEKRFLAKRIFDALSQAKKEFEEGKK